MDGAHVAGSPTELHVRSAEPAVGQMAVSGLGVAKAVAGDVASLHVRVADRFGNKFEASAQAFPYTFGCLLNPVLAAGGDKADKKMKAAKGGEKSDGDKRAKGSAKEDEKKAPSLPFEGVWSGSVFEMRYVAQEAGTMDLHLWAATASKQVDDAGGEGGEGGAKAAGDNEHRVPLPGSPFTVHVSEGMASAVGSFVGEAEAGKQGVGFVAGEHILLRPQVRDPFGNASAANEGALSAEHVKPVNVHNIDSFEELPPPKLKGGLGSYELVVEPTRAGLHNVHVKLNGQDITGSPVSFVVTPAAPSSSKCKLMRSVPPENEPLWEKSPIAIVVTLFDKYGNQLDHGGVRVDAKASGVGVSGAKVEDNKDGTYTITLQAGPPGEVKVTVRIDGNDLPPYQLNVQRNPDAHLVDAGGAKAPSAADPGGDGKRARRGSEIDGAEIEEALESGPSAGEKAKDIMNKAKQKGIKEHEARNAAKAAEVAKATEEAERLAASMEPTSPAKGAPLPDVPWMPAATLFAEATAIEKEADEMEKHAGTLKDSFELILGSAIINKLATVGTLQDLMRDWDKNGDGEIGKIEFRQCVTGTDKKSLGIKSANAEIDAFFATLDADGNRWPATTGTEPVGHYLRPVSFALPPVYLSLSLPCALCLVPVCTCSVCTCADSTGWVHAICRRRLPRILRAQARAQEASDSLRARRRRRGRDPREGGGDASQGGGGPRDWLHHRVE